MNRSRDQSQEAPIRSICFRIVPPLSSFHFQHLVHLKRLEPRMGQVKRNGNGRHTFGREPFVSQVAVRTKGDTATSELVVKLAHSFFQLAAFDPDAQITDANIE